MLWYVVEFSVSYKDMFLNISEIYKFINLDEVVEYEIVISLYNLRY